MNVASRFQDRVSEIRTQEISDGKVKILCDYKGALTRSVIYNDRPTTRHPNFDLLWAIFDLCDDIPIKLTWEHVKAHQDDAGLSRPLPRFRFCDEMGLPTLMDGTGESKAYGQGYSSR